jgi:hypothetical protein
MSAYISRMIQRLVPDAEPAVAGPLMNPFVRSRSPIAAIDQRLAVDETLGHGFGGLEAPSDDVSESPMTAATPTTRIQRKAAGPIPSPIQQSVSAPPLAPSTRSPTFVPVASPAGPAADATEVPKATRSAPPLDPGPLFDPTPRYFDEVRTPEPIALESRVESVSTPTPATAARLLEATPRRDSSANSAPIDARVELPPLLPTPNVEHHWMWPQATSASAAPQATSASAAPQLVPSLPAPARAPGPQVQLYIVPRPRAAEPLIPEPGEFARVEAPQPSQTRESSTATRQTHRLAPTPVAQPPSRNRVGKLTIDSISQIGPLDRHFPNRRNFRLRYR